VFTGDMRASAFVVEEWRRYDQTAAKDKAKVLRIPACGLSPAADPPAHRHVPVMADEVTEAPRCVHVCYVDGRLATAVTPRESHQHADPRASPSTATSRPCPARERLAVFALGCGSSTRPL
jgi:hypothetical protein